MVKVVKEYIPKTVLEFAPTHLASLFREFSLRKLKFAGAVCTYCTLRLTMPRGDCTKLLTVGRSLMILVPSSLVTDDEPSPETANIWSSARTESNRIEISKICFCIINTIKT